MLEQEIDQIKERLISELSPIKIYLFGSFASGAAREDSDLDFYIVVSDDSPNIMDMTVKAYKSIRSVRSRAVDIVIGAESRFNNRKDKAGIEREVAKKGVLLYG